jgi:hypothetical protein
MIAKLAKTAKDASLLFFVVIAVFALIVMRGVAP